MPVVDPEVQKRIQLEPGRRAYGLSQLALISLVATAGLCAGCGQRGPLYLPNATGTGKAPGSYSLSSTPPLFPAIPLTSDTTASPAAVTSFDTITPATPDSTDGSEQNQPGLKVTPFGS